MHKPQMIEQVGNTHRLALSAVLIGALILTGCSGTGRSDSSDQPKAAESLSGGKASTGVISSLRQISLHEDRASESAARTSLVDGKAPIAPSHVSSPNYANQGKTLSMVGNAVLTSLAGDNTDDLPYSIDGQEVTVRLDGGGSRVVVQPVNNALKLNQRVKIITTSSGPTQVQTD